MLIRITNSSDPDEQQRIAHQALTIVLQHCMLQQSTKNLGWDKLQIREDNLPVLKKQFVDSTRDTTARQRIENSIFSPRHEYSIWHYGLLEEIESIAEDLTLLIPDQPSTRVSFIYG